MSDQWYIKTKNGKRGPYSTQQLQRYVDAGALRPNAGVGDGEGPWVAAAKVQGLTFTDEALQSARTALAAARAEAAPTVEASESPKTQQAELDARSEELEQKSAELEQKSAELERKSTELEQKSAELGQKSAELEQKSAELEQKSAVLERKSTELERKSTELEATAESLEARQRELQSRQDAFDQQRSEWDAQVAALDTQRQQVTERESELDQREQQLNEREQELTLRASQLDEQQTSVAETQNQIDQQRADAEAKSEHLTTLQTELETKRAHFKSKASELNEKTEQLEVSQEKLRQDQLSFQQQQDALNDRQSELDRRERELTESQTTAAAKDQSLADSLRTELSTIRSELALRDQEIQTLQQSLAEASRPHDASGADDAETETDTEILSEKQKLLEDFAARQESLSRREAELIRREDELTKREMDITVLGSSAVLGGNAALGGTSAAETQPDAEPDTQAGDTSQWHRDGDQAEDPPSSWEEVLRQPSEGENATIDFDQSEPDDQAEIVADHSTDSDGIAALRTSSVKPATTVSDVSLFDFRRQQYERRFGTPDRYDVDDDPAMRVDVSVHLPDQQRDYATLVSSGMSDYPIAMPNGQRSVRAEVMMYVTHVDELAMQILRTAAKLPYRKKQGLSIGTTGSLQELAELMQGSNQCDCVYLLPINESDSRPIPAKEVIGTSIQLFWLVMITEAERKLIDDSGIHKFLALLEKNNHSAYFDLTRECYVKRKGWFRR